MITATQIKKIEKIITRKLLNKNISNNEYQTWKEMIVDIKKAKQQLKEANTFLEYNVEASWISTELKKGE